ncbi:hypothetical protein L0337_02520 [candidate division KSB1 bacterium]|nr:hypothetical protein [candidate division KSB1 bacterium]
MNTARQSRNQGDSKFKIPDSRPSHKMRGGEGRKAQGKRQTPKHKEKGKENKLEIRRARQRRKK